jgi:hypothetical protein
MVCPRSVCATTSSCPSAEAPIVRDRCSAPECSISGNVVANGSPKTVVASRKLTACFRWLAASLRGSHSNCISTPVYLRHSCQKSAVPEGTRPSSHRYPALKGGAITFRALRRLAASPHRSEAPQNPALSRANSISLASLGMTIQGGRKFAPLKRCSNPALTASPCLCRFTLTRAASLHYGYNRCSMRGNGIVSRTCSSPQIQATARSMPMPKPACGTPPNLRRSRYHLNASSGSSC